MVSWQVTATKIYCNEVAGDVTIMIFKDWSAKCCLKDGMLSKRKEGICDKLAGKSSMCPSVLSYIDKLEEEEKL